MKKSFDVIVEIIKKEFYQIRRDRKMLVVSIIAPFLQVILLGYAATTDIINTTMVICDQDKTQESRDFIQGFTNSGYFVIRYAVNTPPQVDAYITNGKASIALVIPTGFARDLLGRQTAQVQIVLDGADANTANILLGYATQIISSYSQNVVAQYANRIAGHNIAMVVPEPRVWFNPDLLSSNFMVPGVVALVLMIITMTLTSLGIVKEKEMGTLEQLMVTPIRPHELILGKLIPFSLIAFLDVTIVLAVARYWFKVPLLGSIPLLFGLSGLFILTTLGLGLFISTIAKSQQQAMLIAQFFVFMPFLFLGGFAFPIANMPKIIQFFSYVIPLRYFLEILRGIFLKGSGLRELWTQAVALLVIGVVVLTVSVLRFHKKLE
jgi:ABC-2 type transport system permease protein